MIVVSKFIIPAIALLIGSWMFFDGLRAWITGDYVTPSSGPHAGQLGLWSRVVAAIGLDPRGAVMKTVHVLFGVAWLGALACYWLQRAVGWWALVIVSVGTLWYLPIGTVLGAVELALLIFTCVNRLK